ncbi:MAG: NAD(P)/FAD-dependent oxidoreductase [Candidatus Izemoplasmatales bacterium]|nr:NAD(P)/FAD-dependent oxidoreductase [Candidatus Izemoplasmatales bacterium]
MNQPKVIVIGGGASGIIAAIAAKQNNAIVTILERNARIGKKILATGNGRCNYTNALASELDYNHPLFVKSVFHTFNVEQTISFFESLGISPIIEDLGKTFPMSEQASSILDVLLYELEHLGVEIVTEVLVQSVDKNNQKFTVILSDKREYIADKVIISTGGKAMPGSGSDGIGYNIAKSFGHHLVPVFPALVKLKLDCPYLKQLDGVKIQSYVELISKSKVLKEEFGDILFTSYGISGPTILQLSRKANELLLNQEEVFLNVKLVHALSKEDVIKRFENAREKPVDFSLIGLINKRLISAVLKEAKIAKQNTLVKDLSQVQLDTIISLLFSWQFKVSGSKGFEDAQVTAGGIDISEINELTMESKIEKGLFFSGEVIDIDGLCGGYNLQWAWSSGYVAGLNASK